MFHPHSPSPLPAPTAERGAAGLIRLLALAVMLTATVPAPHLVAQVEMQEGDWVRVRFHSGAYDAGHLVEISSAGLLLRTGEGLLADHPVGSFHTVEVRSGGERRFLRNLGLTMAISGVAVGTMQAAKWEPCRPTGWLSCMWATSSRTAAFREGTLVGGILIGVPVGVLVGLVKTHDKWEEGALPTAVPESTSVRVIPAWNGGIGASVSIPVGGRP